MDNTAKRGVRLNLPVLLTDYMAEQARSKGMTLSAYVLEQLNDELEAAMRSLPTNPTKQ